VLQAARCPAARQPRLVRGATGSLAITARSAPPCPTPPGRRWPPSPPGAPPTARSPPTTSPVHRPGIRHAEVAGQLFPSVISELGPGDAAPKPSAWPASSSPATSATAVPRPRSQPSSAKSSRTRDTPGTAAHQRPARHDAQPTRPAPGRLRRKNSRRSARSAGPRRCRCRGRRSGCSARLVALAG
jgi:hypothetical protein